MKNTLFASIALGLLAQPALAQNTGKEAPATARNTVARGHSKSEFMETYDANKDGKVTREEFAARRSEDHKGLDLNQNKQVNEMEYVTEYTFRLDKELAEQRARQIRQAHFRFGVLDTDKDGLLSAAEFDESGTRMFSRLDSNKDGFVDKQDSAQGF